MALPAQPVTGIGPDGNSTVIALWRHALLETEAPNVHDEFWRVPLAQEYHILNIYVELTTDANAGNRQLVIEIQDPEGDVVAQIIPNIIQAASLTRIYNFAPGLADPDAFRDTTFIPVAIPPTWIWGPRYLIRVYDNNAVSATDDMIVHISIARRRLE